MTVDQIRSALDYMEANYSRAMDEGAYGLANAFLAKIDRLRDLLVQAICTEDPHASEADVRFFEGWH
jgi:chromosome condensin MukBEF ATPase and DNA-binding subunit MukB